MMMNENINNAQQMADSIKIFGRMLQAMIETIKTFENYEKIVEKMSQIDMMKLMSLFMAVAEPMRCGFQVLSHGNAQILSD